MMTKHRIGRVQLPWANMEPPIRHPDYYKNLEERKRLERLGAAAPATEKSRRGRSVDLGSVRLTPTLFSLQHKSLFAPTRTHTHPGPC